MRAAEASALSASYGTREHILGYDPHVFPVLDKEEAPVRGSRQRTRVPVNVCEETPPGSTPRRRDRASRIESIVPPPSMPDASPRHHAGVWQRATSRCRKGRRLLQSEVRPAIQMCRPPPRRNTGVLELRSCRQTTFGAPRRAVPDTSRGRSQRRRSSPRVRIRGLHPTRA